MNKQISECTIIQKIKDGADTPLAGDLYPAAYLDVSAHATFSFVFFAKSGDTAQFKLVQAQDSAGTGKKDVTGATIDFADSTPADDEKISIEGSTGILDAANGFTHLAVEWVANDCTGDAFYIATPRLKPSDTYSEVKTITGA